jgi:hypothetical protein
MANPEASHLLFGNRLISVGTGTRYPIPRPIHHITPYPKYNPYND